ncbi:MAG TPA: hypothetical protein G4O17_05670 [Dehalococcoidia bacterium]|jgi:hypothetical protein|nr:hypothetical protein [Dehalococcoidia bacterium]
MAYSPGLMVKCSIFGEMFRSILNLISKKPELAKPNAKLRLLSTGTRREHGYLLIYGLIFNESDQDINNVVAIAECFSSNGTFISKSDMLVDDMTIKPKQISSFSMAAEDEPDIEDVQISFKHFFGEKIAASDIYNLG